MFLKKVLNQPNLVGTVLIALMVCSGFVYAFAFDGFNVETATGGEVEAWLAQAGGGSSGGSGGGGTNDTPPESPPPESPPPESPPPESPPPESPPPESPSFDWNNLDMKDTSTWPSLPSGGTYSPSGTYTGQPSRDKPRERGEKSIWDANGGEWRPEKTRSVQRWIEKTWPLEL